MTAGDILELVQAALLVVLTLAGPLLAVSLVVGLLIGLLQALTQVQEMTLTFVPKLLAMGVVLLVSLPLMGQSLAAFMNLIADRIVHG